jgi:uncharacterized membrane protein YphA (DoxX/SURF4 family)
LEVAGAAVSLVFRLVVGGLLVVWAVSKFRDLRSFRKAIALYRILPGSAIAAAAPTIAALECIAGLMIVAGVETFFASLLGIGLLVLFTAGISINLARGRRIPCGCRTGIEDPISIADVGRNVVLAAALVAVALLPRHPWTAEGVYSARQTAEATTYDGIVSALMAAAVVLAWALFGSAREALAKLDWTRQIEPGGEEVSSSGQAQG